MNLSDWLKEERGRAVVLARHLSLTPVTVSEWSTARKRVALEHCPGIEQFTGGAVTCEELRPDKADYFSLLRASGGSVSQPKPPVVPAVRASVAINSVAAQGA